MAWDPEVYLAHGDLRTRPAADLLARVPLKNPKLIYDLGCGPGNSTALLRARWPGARIVGVDNSEAMLEKAAASGVEAEWRLGDLETFDPDGQPDLLYSNATFHWVTDHSRLFARLARALAPGGVLAVQMPANFEAPSHRLLLEIAGEDEWAQSFAGVRPGWNVLSPDRYYDILVERFERADIWYTEYFQRLAGADAVLSWVKGTTLVPFLERLEGGRRVAFLNAYGARLASAYPVRADGSTLFPFRRLFFVAVAPKT